MEEKHCTGCILEVMLASGVDVSLVNDIDDYCDEYDALNDLVWLWADAKSIEERRDTERDLEEVIHEIRFTPPRDA